MNRKVRKDEFGLYVVNNGTKYRPGKISGYCHVFNMTSGNIKCGDIVKVKNINQSPMCEITKDRVKLVWSSPESMFGKDGVID